MVIATMTALKLCRRATLICKIFRDGVLGRQLPQKVLLKIPMSDSVSAVPSNLSLL